jgi:ATP-dependent Clp protease ATP-binding subunit ClpC
VRLEATAAAKELLAEEGYSEEYGARPLRRVIQSRIEDILSDAILAGTFSAGDTVVADAEEDEIVLRRAEGMEKESSTEPVPA